MIGEMQRETRTGLRNAYTLGLDTVIDHETHMVFDASFASQARIVLNRLRAKFDNLFGSEALSISKNVVEETDAASARSMEGALRSVAEGLTLPRASLQSPDMQEVLKASITQNVGLIKSIPSDYFDRIEGSVMRSITTGQGQAELATEIEKIGQSTRKRAELIARDQTSKAFTAINRQRMQSFGIKKFKWVHSGGGKEPRPLHKNVLNGNIYEVDNPPTIDENTGEKGLPGQLINCKCVMVPVVSFLD